MSERISDQERKFLKGVVITMIIASASIIGIGGRGLQNALEAESMLAGQSQSDSRDDIPVDQLLRRINAEKIGFGSIIAGGLAFIPGTFVAFHHFSRPLPKRNT